MLDNYGAYSQAIMDTWQSFSGNDGQMTIVHDYIIPMSMDHIQFAKEEWPWSGDADEYLESVINCFDDEVMMRAFSETIFALYDTIADYWLESDSIQQDHDDILGHSAVHSTNPPWVG